MKRHIGKLKNTGSGCVVVFMQIPGRESHALVVSIDNLPSRIETFLMQVLESPEGQNNPVLANVMQRKLLPDTGRPLLEELHHMGLLMAVPVDHVVMLPLPNMPFPLRQIIEQMGGQVPNAPTPTTPEISQPETDKFNPYGQTQQIEATATSKGIAANLIVEASLLEQEAANKREAAYRYDPSLRPTVLQSPTAAATTVAIQDGSATTNASLEKVVKRSRTRKKSSEA